MSALVRRETIKNFDFAKSTLTIDPGSKGLAWAEWQGATMLSCGLHITEQVDIEDRAQDHADYFRAEAFARVVVERMTHYSTGQARDAKANDLLDLQLIGAYVAGKSIEPDGRILFVRPAEWKGQVPKDVMGRRIFAKLSDTEKERYGNETHRIRPSLRHNVLDAIGIGLWFFGRLGGSK